MPLLCWVAIAGVCILCTCVCRQGSDFELLNFMPRSAVAEGLLFLGRLLLRGSGLTNRITIFEWTVGLFGGELGCARILAQACFGVFGEIHIMG